MDMQQFIYTICDDEGYTLLEVRSALTMRDEQVYFDDHIRPLLPAIARSHNRDIAQWNCAGKYDGDTEQESYDLT